MAEAPKDVLDPDAALMVAFQKGDEGAFEKLLDKYRSSIVNFIYKIVNNRGEAEDLAQDVFLKIYRARANYEPRARFAAWIYRIATNVSLKAIDRKRPLYAWIGGTSSDGTVANPEPTVPDPSPDAEDRLIVSELGKVVRQAILNLPKNEKLAIILRRYEGLTYKEIAEVMNCTEAAVKTYIHRGKLHLRARVLPYLKEGKA